MIGIIYPFVNNIIGEICILNIDRIKICKIFYIIIVYFSIDFRLWEFSAREFVFSNRPIVIRSSMSDLEIDAIKTCSRDGNSDMNELDTY